MKLRDVLGWMGAVFVIALLLFLGAQHCHAQASPYSVNVYKAQTFTATGQTGAAIPLNGLTSGSSTVGSSYSSGTITLTGVGLTTATFSISGSSDNGVTYFPLNIYLTSTPGSYAASITAQGNGTYAVNLANITHVKFITSGTFTASSISLTLAASPNAFAIPGGNGGGGTPLSLTTNGSSGPSTLNGGVLNVPVYTAGATPQFSTTGNSIPLAGPEAAGYVPVGQSASTAVLRQLTQDDIAPGFTINSFTGSQTVEIGATITNPAFSATYSSTPASASVTNTDAVNSPLALTSPYTSVTVTGSFAHSSASTTAFTLSAVSSTTKTATQTLRWLPSSFGGVGTAGATGASNSSGNAALAGATGTLANAGLSSTQVGLTYGPYAPSGQKVYLLLVGTGHTFKDPSTGFSFAFNAPTAVSYVNAQGATVAMYLYESTNTLTGSFSVQVVN